MVSMETGLSLEVSGRVKRGWVWNQFFVVEEYTGTEPLYVGKVRKKKKNKNDTGKRLSDVTEAYVGGGGGGGGLALHTTLNNACREECK